MRGTLMDTVSSPIWVEPGWGGVERGAAARAAVGRSPSAGRRSASGYAPEVPAAGRIQPQRRP